MHEPVPDPFSDFLNTVRGMVQDDSTSHSLGSAEQAKPRSRAGARRADTSLRRHEDKLAKAERRSARKRRKRARSSNAARPLKQPNETPDAVGRVPAQATGTATEDDPSMDVTAVAAQGRAKIARRVRRRDRRRAAALAAVHPTEDEPELVHADGSTEAVVEPSRGKGTSRRLERRRERRRDAARAVTEQVPLAGSADPPSDAETAGEGAQSVEPAQPRPGRVRRRGTIALVALLLVGAAAVPWVSPDVPRFLADLVPGQDAKVATVKDPPVAPSSEAFTGPVGVEQQGGPYAGVRLEAAGWPRQVVVPRLHVDSEVVPISGQSGSLLPPSDPQVLGWWREGRPVGAQYGTAVVTGHTVHTGGGALDHLDKLVVGDSLRVRTDAGWIRYVVQQTRIYSTAELARDAEKVFRLGGTGRLVVITCDDWNGQSYDSNAVVVAIPVLDEPTSG